MTELVEKFQEFSSWRFDIGQDINRLKQWLAHHNLNNAQIDSMLSRIHSKLREEKLSIAFVAEFSRGKSELINAIFFADYGKRILPSSAGRTTMCPTELMYDEGLPSSIRLLPIETRREHTSTQEYKDIPHEWVVLPLDTTSGDGMLDALRRVSETKRVPVAEAMSYGLHDPEDPDQASSVDAAGTVEISKWRHAVINFPHPLLEQGLVIVDTPGLNAIGTEPELTLNLIPNAQAVLFILAADTGVTKSDIEVWRSHISGGRKQGRLVVLNKIDSMWDELKTKQEIDAEINKQVVSVANILHLEQEQVFPVSAQKGLVAKVQNDRKLLERSRLLDLETALSDDILPSRRTILAESLAQEIDAIGRTVVAVMRSRSRGLVEQLVELRTVRGKNENVITHMFDRIKQEKTDFDRALVALQGTRAVFFKLTNEVFTTLGMERFKTEVRAVRQRMFEEATSAGVRRGFDQFFRDIRQNLHQAGHKTDEITNMLAAMFKKFGNEFGMSFPEPTPFWMQRYLDEITRIEEIYERQFGTLSVFTTEKYLLVQKFFETIATRIKYVYETANRDVESWFKSVMAPLDAQAKEHQLQLKRRLESIKKVQEARHSLEDRVHELERLQTDVDNQNAMLNAMLNNVKNKVSRPPDEAANEPVANVA